MSTTVFGPNQPATVKAPAEARADTAAWTVPTQSYLFSSILDRLMPRFPAVTQTYEAVSLTRAQQRTYMSALRRSVKIID